MTSTSTREPGVLSAPYLWMSIGMCALVFLAAFEALAVATVMPIVADDLDGDALYALAFSGPLAAGVVGMVIAGNWSDRRGPRMPLYTAVAFFVIGLVIAGTATTMGMLVVGRLVHGLGGGALIVPLYVIVARIYPERLQPNIFAGFAAAWVIPSIVGPAAAGVIAESLSWHWVFLGVILLVAPALAMILPPLLRAAADPATQLRGPAAGEPPVPWSLGRIAWSLLAATAVLVLSVSAELGELWRWVGGALALVVALLALRPLVPSGTLRAVRGLPSVILLRMLLAAAFFGAEIYVPYLLMDEYRLSAPIAGLALTGAGLSWAAASWLQGRLADRLPSDRALRIGSTLLVVAIAGMLVTSLLMLPPVLAVVAWVVAGGGMGLVYPRLSVLTLGLSRPEEQGFNSAALSIGDSMGGAIALSLTAIATSLAADPAGSGEFSAVFALTLVIGLVAVLLAGRVRTR